MQPSLYERRARRIKLGLHHGPALFWLDDWKTSIALLGGMVCILLAMAWFFRGADRIARLSESWPTVEASVVNYRIMTDIWPPHRRPNFIQYSAEYKVRYVVDGKSYQIWAPTDIVSSSRQEATADAAAGMFGANYVVRYNPKHPAQAEGMRASLLKKSVR